MKARNRDEYYLSSIGPKISPLACSSYMMSLADYYYCCCSLCTLRQICRPEMHVEVTNVTPMNKGPAVIHPNAIPGRIISHESITSCSHTAVVETEEPT